MTAVQGALARRSEELERELTEAREQQTASAEILSAISGSPKDVQRVFDAVAKSAARLSAYDAAVLLVDGDVLRVVGHHGPMPTAGPLGKGTLPLTRAMVLGRA